MPVGTPRVLTRAEITWRPNLGTCPSICIWRITLTAHALHTLSKRAEQAKLLQQLLASPPPAAPLSGIARTRKLDALTVNMNVIAPTPPRSREATGAIKPRRPPFRHPNNYRMSL